jgi:hypothetical protein
MHRLKFHSTDEWLPSEVATGYKSKADKNAWLANFILFCGQVWGG